jgi:hypothetical protein
VVAVGAVVCVVVLLLSKYDAPKKDNATSQLKPVVTEEQSGSELEKEASEMISSNPAAAAKKFQEAESAYRKSGSPEKASEMADNAATAKQAMHAQGKAPATAPPASASGE